MVTRSVYCYCWRTQRKARSSTAWTTRSGQDQSVYHVSSCLHHRYFHCFLPIELIHLKNGFVCGLIRTVTGCVRFQVLTAVSIKLKRLLGCTAVFLIGCRLTFQRCVLTPSSLIASETSINIQLRTWQYIPEDSELCYRLVFCFMSSQMK
jgi:hypothetical protein